MPRHPGWDPVLSWCWRKAQAHSPHSSASCGPGSLPIGMTCSPGTYEAPQALGARETGLGFCGPNIPTGAAGWTASERAAGALDSGQAEAGEVCDMPICSPASGSQELGSASMPRATGPQSVMIPQEKIQ